MAFTSAITCTVTGDRDSYCLQADITLGDRTEWMRVTQGMPVTVRIGAQEINVLVDSKSMTRRWGAKRQFSVHCRSATSRMDEPYADLLDQSWTNTTARTVAQEVCGANGITLEWNVVDWPLSSVSAESETPIAFLDRLISEACVLQTGWDGSTLRVEYRYPVSPTLYDGTAPELVLSSRENTLSLSSEREEMPCYNSVVIMDPSSESSQITRSLQVWAGPDGDLDAAALDLTDWQQIVAFVAWPLSSATLESSGCDAQIFDKGLQTFTYTETVAFVQGEVSTTWPTGEVSSVKWLCRDLGTITVSGNGKALTAEIASQSLAEITYVFQVHLYLVESPSGDSVQLEVVEDDSDADTSTAITTVARDPGDRPSPGVTADELCTNVAIASQRGRNYLDQYGFNKVRHVIQTPGMELVRTGAVAEIRVHDLGETSRGMITGFTLSIVKDGDTTKTTVDWDIEESLT